MITVRSACPLCRADLSDAREFGGLAEVATGALVGMNDRANLCWRAESGIPGACLRGNNSQVSRPRLSATAQASRTTVCPLLAEDLGPVLTRRSRACCDVPLSETRSRAHTTYAVEQELRGRTVRPQKSSRSQSNPGNCEQTARSSERGCIDEDLGPSSRPISPTSLHRGLREPTLM